MKSFLRYIGRIQFTSKDKYIRSDVKYNVKLDIYFVYSFARKRGKTERLRHVQMSIATINYYGKKFERDWTNEDKSNITLRIKGFPSNGKPLYFFWGYREIIVPPNLKTFNPV